jgi:hypothetical protein
MLLSIALLTPIVALSPAVPAAKAEVIPLNCNWPGAGNYHNGVDGRLYNFITARGVSAIIYSKDRIAKCIDPNPLDAVGASYWVSLQPAPGNPWYGDDNAIIQIGVIWCFDVGSGPCQNGKEVAPRLFYAVGGCAGVEPGPIDLAPAPAVPGGGMLFKIERLNGGTYRLSVDDPYAAINIPPSNQALSCGWLDSHPVQAGWYCERFDQSDSCGGAGTGYKVGFRNIREQKAVGGMWFYPGQLVSGTQYGYVLNDGSCNADLADDHCDVRTDLQNPPDDIDLWTVN